MDFKIGDAVKLKEGYSPIMIVSAVNLLHMANHIECKWYSQKEEKFIFDNFHKDTLKLYTKSPVKKTEGCNNI